MDRASHVTTKQRLLTSSWTADVQGLETAINRFNQDGRVTNDCEVAFFEVARDTHLHVNVTHRHQTRAISGWAGPASMPAGFVHNRTFDHTSPGQVIRHIREMVFAARV